MEHPIRLAAIAFLACVSSACGDNRSACDQDDCDSAGLLAARYTTALAPSLDEVLEARRVYTAGFEPLRATLGRRPTPHGWNVNPLEFEILTQDPRFAGPWSRGEIESGVAAVDDVLSQCHVTSVSGSGAFFVFRTSWYVAGQNIDVALMGEPSLSIDYSPLVPPGSAASDVRLDVIDSDATDVRYSIGWGDCWTGCDGEHFWRVRVTRTDHATLEEEWGDPIPSDVLAAWQ